MSEDPSRPATKLDLADLRAHIDQRFGQVVEVTRDMQTEVLRSFHDWPGQWN